MTINELLLASGAYSLLLVVVAYFTRATARRIGGTLAGGAVVGLFFLVVTALAAKLGLWWVPIDYSPAFLSWFYFDIAISSAPIYLVTWRIVRRFGKRGLAVLLAVVAVVGPIRDYRVAAMFPRWMVFAPGFAPVLGVSATYVGIVALGHAVMSLVAGPAEADQLATRPRGNPSDRPGIDG